MTRKAVVAGTATSVPNRVSRRQEGRWATQEQQQMPANNVLPTSSHTHSFRNGGL
jgi:hypothetical protein